MKIRNSYKIVLLGDASVGKSSIISQFIEGHFKSSYKPTVEDFHCTQVQLKSGFDPHTVHILDCSGTHQFPAMRELSIRTGRGFILVFALDSESSFNETVELYKQIIKIRGDNESVPIVLVGNKSDLPRVLDEQTISKRKMLEMNDIPYIETSAKLNRNISEIFQELLMLTLEQENRVEQDRKLQDKQQQKKARNQQLLRRLSTFGSLPNINLIRRKSNSTNHNNNSNNNHSSNSSISDSLSSSSSSGAEDNSSAGSPKHAVKGCRTNAIIGLVQASKPMFYSPIIRRKFNDNHVKPQLSLDETKIKNLNQRLMNQKTKISNTKSFDTASTTSSFSGTSSNNSTNGSIKGSKESLENAKCQVM